MTKLVRRFSLLTVLAVLVLAVLGWWWRDGRWPNEAPPRWEDAPPTRPSGADIALCLAFAPSDLVFVGGQKQDNGKFCQARVVAYSLRDGRRVWEWLDELDVPLPHNVSSIAADADGVYVGLWENWQRGGRRVPHVVKLSAATGKEKWRWIAGSVRESDHSVDVSIAERGALHVSIRREGGLGFDGIGWARVDTDSPHTRWSWPPGRWPSGGATGEPSRPAAAVVICPNGDLIGIVHEDDTVPLMHCYLVRLAANDGHIVWKQKQPFELPQRLPLTHSIALTGHGEVVATFGGNQATIACWEADTGALRWTARSSLGAYDSIDAVLDDNGVRSSLTLLKFDRGNAPGHFRFRQLLANWPHPPSSPPRVPTIDLMAETFRLSDGRSSGVGLIEKREGELLGHSSLAVGPPGSALYSEFAHFPDNISGTFLMERNPATLRFKRFGSAHILRGRFPGAGTTHKIAEAPDGTVVVVGSREGAWWVAAW